MSTVVSGRDLGLRLADVLGITDLDGVRSITIRCDAMDSAQVIVAREVIDGDKVVEVLSEYRLVAK